MSTWKYFKLEEFNCPDCGLNTMDPAMIDILDDIRSNELAQYPMVIDSGTRCPVHNAAVGGKPASAHLTGPDGHSHAADVHCDDDRMRFLLVKALIARGITRIEDGKDWIHADNSPYLPQEGLFHA